MSTSGRSTTIRTGKRYDTQDRRYDREGEPCERRVIKVTVALLTPRNRADAHRLGVVYALVPHAGSDLTGKRRIGECHNVTRLQACAAARTTTEHTLHAPSDFADPVRMWLNRSTMRLPSGRRPRFQWLTGGRSAYQRPPARLMTKEWPTAKDRRHRSRYLASTSHVCCGWLPDQDEARRRRGSGNRVHRAGSPCRPSTRHAAANGDRPPFPSQVR